MTEYNQAWQLTGQLRAGEAIPLLKQIISKDKTFYRAYGTLAEAYHQKGGLEKAEQYFRSLAARDPQSGQAHYAIAEIHLRRQQWDLAVSHYTLCIQKSPQTYPCYERLVSALKDSRKHSVTVQDLQSGFLTSLNSPFRQLLISAIHRASFDPATTKETLDAVRIAQSRNDLELIALLEYWLGHWFAWNKDYRNAMRYFENSLDIYRELGDLDMQLNVTTEIGGTHIQIGDFDHGRLLIESSLALARKLGQHRHMARGMIARAGYHKLRGNPEAALRSYQDAKREFEVLNDPASALDSLLQVGSLYEEIGEMGRARESFAECRNSAVKVRLRWHEAFALRRLGDVYRDSGEYLKALGSLNEAIRIFREEGFAINAAAALRVIGSVHSALGNYSYAHDSYEKSLAEASQFSDMEQQERTLQGLGHLYLMMAEPMQAVTYLKRSLSVSDRTRYTVIRLSTLLDLGKAYYMLDDPEASIAQLSEGLRIARQLKIKPEEALALTGLGWTHLKEGRLRRSEECFRESLAIAHTCGILEVKMTAREGLAEICIRRGALLQALQHLQPAIETMESLRGRIPTPELRASFIQERWRVYETIVDVLSRLHARNPRAGYDRQAFAYVERSRARAFLDLLAESKAGITRGLSADQVRQQNQLQAKLSRASAALLREASEPNRRSVESAERQLAEWALDLRRANPRYHELVYPKPYDAESAQSAISSGNVLLEYILGEHQSFVWVVTTAQTKMVALPGRAEIERQVASFRAASAHHPKTDFDAWQAPSRHLYQMLIGPVETLLVGKQHLVIVPDGVLFYLPFEALMSTAPNGSTRFLIDDHAIAYAPSASVYGNLLAESEKQRPTRTHDLLAYGNPVFSSQGSVAGNVRLGELVRGVYQSVGFSFPALPNTQIEVETIGALYSSARRKIYLGQNATEASVKRENLRAYTRVHFATHAVLDEQVPARSGVVLSLADAEDEDGILRANEVFNLELNADVVVLSACQTGLGALVKGEGIVGLTRAFLYAGSPRVVVSLWEVNDRTTSAFMKIFYQKMNDGRSPGVALREAKLELLRSGSAAYRHPYFWTAFVLVGIP